MYTKWIAGIFFGIATLQANAQSYMHFMSWDAETAIPVTTKMVKKWALHFCHLKEPVWLNLSKPVENTLFNNSMVRTRLVAGKSI